jgi:hypothetical protein
MFYSYHPVRANRSSLSFHTVQSVFIFSKELSYNKWQSSFKKNVQNGDLTL